MYAADSPQFATAQSAVDSNRKFDGVRDRGVINPDGAASVGSDVSGLTYGGGVIVGYLVDDPFARYFAAVAGVHAYSNRNTLSLRRINNFDGGVSEWFAIGQAWAVEFRIAFCNKLDHQQCAPSPLSAVRAVPSNSRATTRFRAPGIQPF